MINAEERAFMSRFMTTKRRSLSKSDTISHPIYTCQSEQRRYYKFLDEFYKLKDFILKSPTKARFYIKAYLKRKFSENV